MPLYLQSSGPAGAPAILFLHGGGVSGWMWRPVVGLLPEFHSLVPDLPEHGQTADEKPFTMAGAASRVIGLIDSYTPAHRAHVVGLSLGGQLAVQLLSMAPEAVDHAVVSGTLVRPLPGMGAAGLISLLGRMYMPFRNHDWLVRANLKSADIPLAYLPQFREDTRRLTADSFSHMTLENANFRIPRGLGGILTPALILVGENEPRVMRESARDLAKILPCSKAFRVRNVGHSWILHRPDLAAQIIRGWLTDEPLPEDALDPIAATSRA